MVVDAFWFGVLITIIGVIVIFIVAAFINVKRSEAMEAETDDVWMNEGDFQKMLNEAVREAMRENMFGDEVRDHDETV